MKNIVNILLVVFIFFYLPTTDRENFHGIRYDYMLHYETSFIMATCISGWIGKEDYGIFSVGIPLFIGGMKECMDYHNSGNKFPNDTWKDITFDFLGALSGKLMTYTF
jgi:hypothetical protein